MANAPSPPVSGTTTGAPVIEPSPKVAARGRPGGRQKRPEIDYDTNMRAARQSMKEATKAVAAARAVQKNEARKKTTTDEEGFLAVPERLGTHRCHEKMWPL